MNLGTSLHLYGNQLNYTNRWPLPQIAKSGLTVEYLLSWIIKIVIRVIRTLPRICKVVYNNLMRLQIRAQQIYYKDSSQVLARNYKIFKNKSCKSISKKHKRDYRWLKNKGKQEKKLNNHSFPLAATNQRYWNLKC